MSEEIFRISKNSARAKALKDMAEDRLKDIKKENKTYKIIEGYYEIIKELMTALMYLDGFKTLSHKSLIHYLEINYKTHFNREQIILTDELRKLRNDILYYGKKIDSVYLTNKESEIKIIIQNLINLLDEKLRHE